MRSKVGLLRSDSKDKKRNNTLQLNQFQIDGNY